MSHATLASVPVMGGASVAALRWCGICGAGYRSDFARCPSDGGELREQIDDPLIGATLGEHYVVDALIGQGAMGRVYRAHHAHLVHRRYAIKVLLGDLAATPAMRLRFEREAEAASRLDHPCLIGVTDAGRSPAGLMYLVMELVEGETLGQLLRRTKLEPARVLRIARQLAEALDHAHARGVIHRDIKPDNVVVVADADGGETARLGDFGLALTTWDDARLTSTGVMCTPAYASPEQIAGNDLDERTDLYALGTTLFEIVTGGKLPFPGDAQQVMSRKMIGRAPQVRSIAPDVPPALAALIDALLQRDRKRRPASARDVLTALDALQAMDLVACRPRRLSTQSFTPIVRSRTGRAAGATIAIAAAASLGAWLPDRDVHAGAATVELGATGDEPGLDVRTVAHVVAQQVERAAQAYRAVLPATRAIVPHVPVVRAITAVATPAASREVARHRDLELLALDVRGGGMRRIEVERALQRVWPQLQACTAHANVHVTARFRIDDTRRATEIQLAGRTASSASTCIAGVLANVRTAEAPDTGDAAVTAELVAR